MRWPAFSTEIRIQERQSTSQIEFLLDFVGGDARSFKSDEPLKKWHRKSLLGLTEKVARRKSPSQKVAAE
jgi:hypothetical protein